jgi:hypothetical protein
MAYLTQVVQRKLENKSLAVIVDNNTTGHKYC